MVDGERRILHLIYIHGFNGDRTTFQAFPTDLHAALVPRLAQSHPNLELKSSLYPTYKSRRPLTEATNNFLQWMTKQLPADVILAGHSMGGLLAAEAATSVSKHGKDHRVIGLLSFDTPFLGMHPHVIISGIASLFPQDDEKIDTKSEAELNNGSTVELVTEHDVQQSQNKDTNGDRNSNYELHHTKSGQDDDWDNYKSRTDLSDQSSTPSRKQNSQNFLQKSMAFLAKHSDDPVVKFLKKHKDNPVGAAKTWIVEHFAFGVIMFEPKELLARYKILEHWDKPWINYWTVTVERPVSGDHTPTTDSKGSSTNLQILDQTRHYEDYPSIGELYADMSNSQQSSESGHSHSRKPIPRPLFVPGPDHSRSPSPTPSSGHTPIKGDIDRNLETPFSPKLSKTRHFITTPSSRSRVISNWEKVQIKGVKDEVAAHCGIFILSQNLEYIAFVERVATRVQSWIPSD